MYRDLDQWLLPLPLLERPAKTTSTSSRCRQRFKSKILIWTLANSLVRSINALYSGTCKTRTTHSQIDSSGELINAVKRTHTMCLREACRLHHARRDSGLSGVAAVEKLVKTVQVSQYSFKSPGKNQVPLAAMAIDEPAVGATSVHMLDALPREESEFYAEEKNLFDVQNFNLSTFREIERHYGFVGGSQEEYVRYFCREEAGPIWDWQFQDTVKAVAGFSVVPKKNPVQQRKLLMQCAANFAFVPGKERADHGMHGGLALNRMWVPANSMMCSSFDESNAFTFIITPEWMWAWSACPPIRAKFVMHLLPSHILSRVSPNTYVFPCYKRLAMGGSHSVHILMSINLTCVGRTLIYSRYLSTLPNEPPNENDPPDSMELDGVCNDYENVGLSDKEWCEWRQSLQSSEVNSVGTNPDLFKLSLDEVETLCRSARTSQTRTFVIFHAFSGDSRSKDLKWWLKELSKFKDFRLIVITADLATDKRWDLAKPETFSRLMAMAEEGFIDVVIGGPPCSTWSRARFIKLPDGYGPRPLRHRGKYAWGLPNLSPHEQRRVQEANILLIHFLALCEAVSSRGGAHLLEHPADPGRYPYPSIFDTELVQQVEDRTSAIRTLLDQCAVGGIAQKPTCLSGTLENMLELSAKCPGVSATHTHGKSHGRDEAGGFFSRRLARYPSELCRRMASCILATCEKMYKHGTGPGGSLLDTSKIRRVSCWSSSGSQRSPGVAFLNEATVRNQHVIISPTQTAFYLHVDDGLFISDDKNTPERNANALMEKSADALTQLGFKVTDRNYSPNVERIVGYEPELHPARVRFRADRSALLYESLKSFSRSYYVDVDVLHSVLGVWLWGALLKRPLLSIPSAIFTFVNKYQHQVVPLWRSVRNELRVMADAVMLMYADLGAPLSSWIYATDAMGAGETDETGGFGIVGLEVDDKLRDKTFTTGCTPGFTVTRLDGDLSRLHNPDREFLRSIPTTMVPHELFDDDKEWIPIDWGRWRFADHITLGELRTVLRLVSHLSRHASAHRHRIMSLQDNRPVQGSSTKGRSCAPALNFLLRKIAAIAAACEFIIMLPWTESKLMPADELSRTVSPPCL